VVGVSADERAQTLEQEIRGLLRGLATLLGFGEDRFAAVTVDVDDRFVGGGYGESTTASEEAIALAARTEALFLDPTYTAKAMAGLIARLRRGDYAPHQTILFWHTGGQVNLFR
jgi:1-aminocyclopropane-1-carboxylate deaminase/D-cysteine desulfhydrase-like pyridoxal-dependent ACC family enzyme